jgi:hypothetical protein
MINLKKLAQGVLLFSTVTSIAIVSSMEQASALASHENVFIKNVPYMSQTAGDNHCRNQFNNLPIYGKSNDPRTNTVLSHHRIVNGKRLQAYNTHVWYHQQYRYCIANG